MSGYSSPLACMKAKGHTQKIVLGLCLMPCAWAVVAYFGGLGKLENALLDLRFRFRGELAVEPGEVPKLPASGASAQGGIPKVVYVDLDPKALSSPEAGERPWDRKFFAKVGRILLDERVGARVVGYDFIFSSESMSQMVLEEKRFGSEQVLGSLVEQHPDKVVLAANYTGVSYEFQGERIPSFPPLLYRDGYKSEHAENYPEAPNYPMLFYKDGKEQGRLGIIAVEMERSKGAIPRWVPLYFPYSGDAHAKKQLLGLRFAHPIEKQDDETTDALAVAEAKAKKQQEEHQLLQALGATIEAVDKATDELGQLEAMAKAEPDTAATLQEVMEAKAVAKKAAEKQLTAVLEIIGGQEGLASLRDHLSQPGNPSSETLSLIQAEMERVGLELVDAAKEVEVARLKKESIRAEPFDRESLGFELDEENEHWLLKNGEQVVERVPQIRKNPYFFHLSISMILAAYGLDWENVEISPRKLIVRDKSGSAIVDAALVDEQLLEVNWFSKWRQELLDVSARESMVSHRDSKNRDAFFQAAETALLGAIDRAGGEDADKTLSATEKLAALHLPEVTLAQVNELLAKIKDHDDSEKLDEWHERIMALLGELDKKSIPPFLASKYNPRCSIIDVFNFGDFFLNETIRGFAANPEKTFDLIEAEMHRIQKLIDEDPQLKEKGALLIAKINRDKAALIEKKADYEMAERFFAHFKDAIVLVGPVDPMLQDLALTPFDDSPVPKVGVHGNLIKTLLTGKHLQRPAGWVEYAGIFGLSFLMIFLGFRSGSLSNWTRPLGIVAQAIYVVAAFMAFKHSHWILPVAGPIGASLSTSFAVFAVKLVIEEKAKGRIKGMFGTYVSQELVEQMVESGNEPSLGGEETEITAFFSDVQSFSSFSELLTPNQLVALMNEYLTAMTEIVQQERGTLDKYIGDAIVAMYGAPIPMEDHAYQSVKTGLLMQERQVELREKWKADGDEWPDVVSLMQTRIGCNTGKATVGNMGSTDRFNYTMMGDMVNLAARCESGAKSYGAYLMVTEETKVAAEATRDDVAYRYLDKIVVKGRTQPIAMHEPIGLMGVLSQETQDCLDCFRQGIDKYLAQDWKGALDAFEKAKELEPNKPGVTPGVKDNPSMIFIDRCQVMQANPPGDDWDGVYVMTSK